MELCCKTVVWVCVCVWEREREKERGSWFLSDGMFLYLDLCVCVCVHFCVRPLQCLCEGLCVRLLHVRILHTICCLSWHAIVMPCRFCAVRTAKDIVDAATSNTWYEPRFTQLSITSIQVMCFCQSCNSQTQPGKFSLCSLIWVQQAGTSVSAGRPDLWNLNKFVRDQFAQTKHLAGWISHWILWQPRNVTLLKQQPPAWIERYNHKPIILYMMFLPTQFSNQTWWWWHSDTHSTRRGIFVVAHIPLSVLVTKVRILCISQDFVPKPRPTSVPPLALEAMHQVKQIPILFLDPRSFPNPLAQPLPHYCLHVLMCHIPGCW